MHRSHSAAILAALLSFSALAAGAGTSPDSIQQAKRLLERNDAAGAAALLESALPNTTTADRGAILELLRSAYDSAARQAEAAGRADDAAAYRDNLDILNRKPRKKSPGEPRDPSVRRASAVEAEPPAQSAPDPAPVQKPAPAPQRTPPPVADGPPLEPLPEPQSSEPPPPRPVQTAPPVASAPVTPDAQAAATAVPGAAPARTGNEAARAQLEAALAAFKGRRYDEAGRIFSTLQRAHQLPQGAVQYWVYCRLVRVVNRINAKPSTPREWAEIDAELKQIETLSPKSWYADYLRNLVAERAPRKAASPRSKGVVIRGASPDETPTPLLPLGDAPQAKPRPKSGTPAERSATPRTRIDRKPTKLGNWLVLETTNFRILYADYDLAEQVAHAAEAAREAQTKRWTGKSPRGPWTPRCDIYLYPTGQILSRMTGQPEESPGFSTMGMNGGQIIARRINLRADHKNLVNAIVPHEVTHVVLADLFPHKQIPRWADEGMAVLAEPHTEQRIRVADLDEPLSSGRLFELGDLMQMDYPDGRYWALYYAQSVSLTRFLVDQGTPAQFIEFVRGIQRSDHQSELRRIYKIDGFPDLQKRWVAYARSKGARGSTATAAGAGSTARQ
jgi:hypothetical protein